jgi:hypothetical protein
MEDEGGTREGRGRTRRDEGGTMEGQWRTSTIFPNTSAFTSFPSFSFLIGPSFSLLSPYLPAATTKKLLIAEAIWVASKQWKAEYLQIDTVGAIFKILDCHKISEFPETISFLELVTFSVGLVTRTAYSVRVVLMDLLIVGKAPPLPRPRPPPPPRPRPCPHPRPPPCPCPCPISFHSLAILTPVVPPSLSF